MKTQARPGVGTAEPRQVGGGGQKTAAGPAAAEIDVRRVLHLTLGTELVEAAASGHDVGLQVEARKTAS